jgi:hypothetical protein
MPSAHTGAAKTETTCIRSGKGLQIYLGLSSLSAEKRRPRCANFDRRLAGFPRGDRNGLLTPHPSNLERGLSRRQVRIAPRVPEPGALAQK